MATPASIRSPVKGSDYLYYISDQIKQKKYLETLTEFENVDMDRREHELRLVRHKFEQEPGTVLRQPQRRRMVMRRPSFRSLPQEEHHHEQNFRLSQEQGQQEEASRQELHPHLQPQSQQQDQSIDVRSTEEMFQFIIREIRGLRNSVENVEQRVENMEQRMGNMEQELRGFRDDMRDSFVHVVDSIQMVSANMNLKTEKLDAQLGVLSNRIKIADSIREAKEHNRQHTMNLVPVPRHDGLYPWQEQGDVLTPIESVADLANPELKGTQLNALLRFYGFEEGRHFNSKCSIALRKMMLATALGIPRDDLSYASHQYEWQRENKESNYKLRMNELEDVLEDIDHSD